MDKKLTHCIIQGPKLDEFINDYTSRCNDIISGNNVAIRTAHEDIINMTIQIGQKKSKKEIFSFLEYTDYMQRYDNDITRLEREFGKEKVQYEDLSQSDIPDLKRVLIDGLHTKVGEVEKFCDIDSKKCQSLIASQNVSTDNLTKLLEKLNNQNKGLGM